MHWLDTTILVILGIGAILGMRSGLVWQIARLSSLGAAIYVAIIANDAATEQCQDFLRGADPRLVQSIAYGAVFLGVYLSLFLLAKLVHAIVRATDLVLLDRFLGAVFGTTKMALGVAVACLAASYLDHPATQETFKASYLAPIFAQGMHQLVFVVPQEYREEAVQKVEGMWTMLHSQQIDGQHKIE